MSSDIKLDPKIASESYEAYLNRKSLEKAPPSGEKAPKQGNRKRSVIIAVIASVVAVALAVVVIATLSGIDRSKMTVDELVDEFHEKYTNDTSFFYDHDYFKSIGLEYIEGPYEKGNNGVAVFKPCLISKEFVENYVSKYSYMDLLVLVLKRQPKIDYNGNIPDYYAKEAKIFHDILDYLEKSSGCFLTYYDILNLHGAEGYYSGKNDIDTDYTVTGKFGNSSTDYSSIHSEEKTNHRTVKYYGDWEISKESGYEYDPGVAKWVNGEFIDIPPSWNSFNKTSVYYKGKKVTESTDFKFFPLSNTNGEFKHLDTGEYLCARVSVSVGYPVNNYSLLKLVEL